MPQFRDTFDAAQSPQGAAFALSLGHVYNAFIVSLVPNYSVGNILYADTATTFARLAPNTTTSKKFLSQTGNGSVSAAPIWETIEAADVTDFNEAVDDRVDALIVDGAGIQTTYNDGAGTLTIASTITQYTDEMAQDAAASLIQNGTGISWSYNDGANTLTPTVTLAPFSTSNLAEGANLYFTDERAQDAVGGILTDSARVDFTYNDAANQITADLVANSVTFSFIQQIATNTLLGRATAGTGNVETITCTAAGRALIDDADAAAQRTTLGLGTAAVKNTGSSGDAVPLLNTAATWSAQLKVVYASADFRIGGSAADQKLTHSFYDNDATLKGRLLYAGANPGGSKYFGFINDAADYLAFWTLNATDIRFLPNASETVRFASGGAAYFPGVGTTASAANAFLNSGSSPANQLLRSTSSLRYKTALQDITIEEASAILALRPVSYQSLATADDARRRHIGLTAEDVAAVDSRLVHLNEKGQPESVQYERLTVMLLRVIKDLGARVAELEGRPA
jgi:hypothetical protein